MKKIDARSLSANAQEVIRKKAVLMVKEGCNQEDVGKIFGVARGTISKWWNLYKKGGEKALESKQQGRPKGETGKLAGWQCAAIKKIITEKYPDQLQLPFFLWTRDAVKALIKYKYGIELSRSTMGRYLKQWGFTPQKPAKQAREQRPEEVQKWLDEEYPAIAKRAKTEGAEIHWADESGVRSDDQKGTTYAPRGKTPVVKQTGSRFRCNMISSVTNSGMLRFSLYKGKFSAEVFIKFLNRLIKGSDKKIFMVLDQYSVHKSKALREWQKKHADQIEFFFTSIQSPTQSR